MLLVTGWVMTSDVDCWSAGCGRGGRCERVCGFNGYCCKKGVNDDQCSEEAQAAALSTHHVCVKEAGENIAFWVPLSSQLNNNNL